MPGRPSTAGSDIKLNHLLVHYDDSMPELAAEAVRRGGYNVGAAPDPPFPVELRAPTGADQRGDAAFNLAEWEARVGEIVGRRAGALVRTRGQGHGERGRAWRRESRGWASERITVVNEWAPCVAVVLLRPCRFRGFGVHQERDVVVGYSFSVTDRLGAQKRSNTSLRSSAISEGSRRSMSLRCSIYKGLPSQNRAMDGDEGG